MIHVDIKSAPAEETKHDFVVLTTSNALSMTLGSTYCKERLLINRRDCWHKFMVCYRLFEYYLTLAASIYTAIQDSSSRQNS